MKETKQTAVLEQTFRIHLQQLKGEKENSKEEIKGFLEQITESNSVLDWSLCIWTLAEQIERFKEDELFSHYKESVERGIENILLHYLDPGDNVFGEGEGQIHTSSLGIYYAALLGIKKVSGWSHLQPTITAIRDRIFSYHLSGGMLTRTAEWNDVSTDMLLSVLPFGLFSPEDLVMVEAVRELENRLVSKYGVFSQVGSTKVSDTSALLLAWYFYEKGNLKKSKSYFQLAKGSEPLTNVLRSIVAWYYRENLVGKEVKIVHLPYGNDNPYEFQETERFPRDPEVGEHVQVGYQVEGVEEGANVMVETFVQVKEEIKCVKTDYFEHIAVRSWNVQLGTFPTTDQVVYWFVVRVNERFYTSDKYSFFPFKKYGVQTIEVAGETEDELWIKGITQESKKIFLSIDKKKGDIQVVNDVHAPNGLKKSSSSLFQVEYGTVEVHSESLRILDKQGMALLQSFSGKIFPLIEWTENETGFIQSIFLNLHSSLDERFFGLGERYHQLEYRGQEIDCYVYNQYRDQGSKTYIPVPFFISSKGYALFLETDMYSVFDFAHQFSNRLQIRCDVQMSEPRLKLRLFTGEPKQVISAFSKETGPAVLPPVWAFGPWMSSNNWDRDSVVREQVKKTNEYNIPSTVFVIEQWSDEATYYIFNDAEYKAVSGEKALKYEDYYFPEQGRWPNPKGLIDYLHNNGLKLILWQIPIHKYLNRQFHPQKDADEQVMIEKGYCVFTEEGIPYRMPEGWFKESLLMDFSNKEGMDWWFAKRQYLLEIGVDGFKTDGGEFVFGRNLQFADGSTGKEMRNRYPNDYIEAYYKFATDYHNGDAITFSRAGYTGGQKYPAHWAGDERSTFEAFRNSLIAGLSSGVSGIPIWGWDLAGFNGDIPTAELFIRSAQMAAFCPIMQYHAESKGEFNQDRTPWNISERTGDDRAIIGYRYYANLRMNLLPYIVEQAKRACSDGLPLMKPLFVEYPKDTSTYSIYDEYLFGESLLVAPIIEEGKFDRMIYFPEGEWIHFFTHEVVNGPTYQRVMAGLTEIPVFVKKGSAIVLNCDESLALGSWVGNEIATFKNPVIRIYPSDGNKLNLEDHLGNKWMVNGSLVNDQYILSVKGLKGTKVMVPKIFGKIQVNGKSPVEIKEDCFVWEI